MTKAKVLSTVAVVLSALLLFEIAIYMKISQETEESLMRIALIYYGKK